LFPGILNRTIFGELAKVFILSLIGLTGLIVMAAIVVEASQRGLGPGQILAAIPLIVPSMMPFIIPPTTLFATCVVYGRLSHDNEITAIKAAGINILHVIWPAVLLGLGASLTTLGLYYYLIPHTHRVLRTAVVNDVEDFMYSMLKRDHEIKGRLELRLNYEMYVETVQGRELKNAIFKRKDTKGNYDVIAKARTAELRVDTYHHEVLVHMRHGRVIDGNGKTRGWFMDRIYAVPLPDVDHEKRIGARDLTWQEILEAQRKLPEEKQKIDELEQKALSDPVYQKGQLDLAQDLLNIRALQHEIHQRELAMATELQMRPALAFGCLFFVLVGCPVGIWFSKSDYLSAFITCFLPIVFIYYPLQLCSTNLAKDGKLHPAVALWSANLVIGIMALALFRRLLKN
jgi:lipopolysaccharide export system permease protein